MAAMDHPGAEVKNAALEDRMNFIRKVYGILSMQLLLTVCIATPITIAAPDWVVNHQWMLQISFGALVVLMCVMCCSQNALREYPMNYAFLFAMSVCMAVVVGFASAIYTWQSVCLAGGITAAVFMSMTVYAFSTKTDFTGAGPYLFAILACLIIFGLTLCILTICGVDITWALMVYNFIGVLLFTFYIVYDTQLLLGEYGGHEQSFTLDDYAFASLNLYMDIINLFLHLLSLLGDNR